MVYGMKRLSFLLGLLLCLPVAAQQVYRARVADGRTGETLPMARIYISQHNCTLSNDEGDFSIQARAEDVMEISYMGYETQRWRAGKLPSLIRMMPMTNVMGEVEVEAVPVKKILLKLIRKLNAENHSYASGKSEYFYRMTNIGTRQKSVIEAFVRAYSTINLNSGQVLNGRVFLQDSTLGWYEGMPDFLQLYQHDIFELGPEVPPMTRSALSAPLNLPLPEWAVRPDDFAGREISCNVIRSEEGETFYRMEVRVDAEASALAGDAHGPFSPTAALSGTLYLKKKPLRLLSFDGELTGIHWELAGGEIRPLAMRIHIDYRHRRGFTEPTTIYCVLKCEGCESRMLAFLVDDRRLSHLQGWLPWGSLQGGIEKAGYAPELWTGEIVRPTEEEEALVNEKVGTTPE